MNRPRVAFLDEIKQAIEAIDGVDLLEAMASGFESYSAGRCVIPPVGELLIDGRHRGEVHIKYGYEREGTHYVIKIASGFPGNPEVGLPGGNGLMILFDLKTGEPTHVLVDEAHLTDVRTGAAGALATRTLAPSSVERIGIIGTGVQGREQLRQVSAALGVTRALVCGRSEHGNTNYKEFFRDSGLTVDSTMDPRDVTESCNVIITCTPSEEPLIMDEWVRPGTHVTAVGSDTPVKQELETGLLARADLVVVDSLEQCRLRGEASRALAAGDVTEAGLTELGSILSGSMPGRQSDDQVTIADLTGVAIQDLRIAQVVSSALDGA